MKALWPSILFYAALFGLAADAQTLQSGSSVSNGFVVTSGQGVFPNGTAAAPSVSFPTNTVGLYSSASNIIDFSIGGADSYRFAATNMVAPGNVSVNSGSVIASNFIVSGTVVATLGSCSFGGFVGGSTAGTFVAQGCGAPATAVTAMVLTFFPSATNGFSCDAQNRTASSSSAVVQVASGTDIAVSLCPILSR